MASCAHLQAINPLYCLGPAASFTRFPLLPHELRLHVWGYALRVNRLFDIELEPLAASEGSSPEGQPPDVPGTKHSLQYNAILHGRQLHSALLRVNRESRHVALRVQRIHLPCYRRKGAKTAWLTEGSEAQTKMTLYINPECDFLRIVGQSGLQHTVVDFIHDVVNLDPKAAGMAKWALDGDIVAELCSIDAIADPAVRASFVRQLSSLSDILWVAESPAGRRILPLQGFPDVRVQFNHAMPVKGSTTEFALLPRDPRPVGPELEQVLTAGSDPRAWRLQWQDLLKKWDVCCGKPARERVLFACVPSAEIATADHARQFLRQEEADWLGAQQSGWHYHLVKKFTGKEPPVETPAQRLNAVRPAVGFWLFPIEALGDLSGYRPGMKMRFDLSGSWPELALSCLSD